MLDPASGSIGFRNRIINGDMRIDQRNAGAAINSAGSGVFPVDRFMYESTQSARFNLQQNAGAVTPPAGFTHYLGVTSTSAYSVLATDIFYVSQRIEGFNIADFAWGTASASAVTLSFWVRSSLTGTFGGCIQNSAQNRSYPFSYAISSVNTWEQKTVTIPGDTTGTWLTNDGVGMYLFFGLGGGSNFSGAAGSWSGSSFRTATGAVSVVGTNGATFYITGVQLERGSTATSFDFRPYGTELMLCQRYFYKTTYVSGTTLSYGAGYVLTTTTADFVLNLPVPMRSTPTSLTVVGAGRFTVNHAATSTQSSSVTFVRASTTQAVSKITVASGLTVGQGCLISGSSTVDQSLAWDVEL